ncbi:MAG: hypothetical protein LBL84_03390 [Candidatus Nomurabacteria bacterium]|jgi:hypothetical protein|nr:hypothetical protein [Candidatus Nomurabacteria bacterium]
MKGSEYKWPTKEEKAEARRLASIPLSPEQSFSDFCKRADIKHLCDEPFPLAGTYGDEWDHRAMDTIDHDLVYKGSLYSAGMHFCCTEHPAENEDWGELGYAALRTNDGHMLVLVGAIYHDNVMWARTTDIGSDDEVEQNLADLRVLEPRMVGIVPYRGKIPEGGYKVVERKSAWPT